MLDHIYANCIDDTALLTGAESFLLIEVDDYNAFSDAPTPKQGSYFQVAPEFNCLLESTWNSPIPDDYM